MPALDVVFIGVLGMLLVQVAVVDLRTRRIPNALNLAIATLGLVHSVVQGPVWAGAAAALFSGVASTLLFLGTLWVLGRITRNAQMGAGDLKFLVAASVWVGWSGAVTVLLIACLCALLEAVMVAPWLGFSLRRVRPFGPMLAVGMLAVAAFDAHQLVR